jgi:hypothetical protein
VNKVPVVGFCNLNQFDFSYAGADLSEFTNDGAISQFNSNYTANDYVTKVSQYVRSNIIRKYLGNLVTLYWNSLDINQMLVSCTFAQTENCSAVDFMFTYDFTYGMCFRFNSGKNLFGNDTGIRTIGQAGWKNGLQLELYAGKAQLQERFVKMRGFRIFVFNRTNVYPVPEDNGIDAATGLATNIGIRRTFTNHLPVPYSNCLTTDITKIDWSRNEALQFMFNHFVDGQYYNTEAGMSMAGVWIWNWTVSYSQSICVKLCFQKYLFQACGNCFFQASFLCLKYELGSNVK